MDTNRGTLRVKGLLFPGALFLVACFLCYGEVVYLLWGKEVRADVTSSYEATVRSRRGRVRPVERTVEYAFTEPDGTLRKDSDTIDINRILPADGTVRVQYTPGAGGRSRLAGHVNWLAFGFLVVSSVLLVVFACRLWFEAPEAINQGDEP
jgi:hypothetical protein